MRQSHGCHSLPHETASGVVICTTRQPQGIGICAMRRATGCLNLHFETEHGYHNLPRETAAGVDICVIRVADVGHTGTTVVWLC
jgi:hypothetical protein